MIKPIFTWCLNRVQIVSHMDFIFQNTQKFPFLNQTWISQNLFKRKGEQLFWFISFYLRRKVWAFREKENRAFWVCVIKSFQAWHRRTSLYLTIAWVRSFVVRWFFSSLLSEWTLSKSRETRTVCIKGVLNVWVTL